jgi:outer membrane protein TolC
MVVRSIGLVLGICALVAAPAHGDDEPPYEPPDFLKELPPLPAGVDASAVWRLDLAEALRLAIHHNLGLAIERQSVEIAQLGIDVARGAFEPALAASAGHNRSDSPPLSAQAGSPGEIVSITGEDGRLTLSQRLPTGTQLGLDFGSSRSRSTAGTAVEPLNYLSSVTLSVIQPLLRGFSRDLVVPRIDVLRAEIASERERQQLLVTAAQVVEQTEDAYWDLVQALYRYDLDLRSRRLAEDQLALTHRQSEIGRADAPGYSVMLNLAWTPWSRAAGAAAEIERAHQRVALAGREQTLQTVWLAVRDAVRTQHSAALQVTAAARFRELATRSLDVEQRRFLASNSSNFLVAQRQQELATAQLSELFAVLTYKKATAALLRATGRLLDERHIELARAQRAGE